MEPEENERVVEEALRGSSGFRSDVGSEIARSLFGKLALGCEAAKLFDRDGYFRTTPGALEVDGFFAAVIAKV